MAKDENKEFRLKRSLAPLPTETEFDPFGGDLDAQNAWRNFGELSMKQAYELLLTNPIHYQEDFVFMGAAAFAYYFPVIDRYVSEVTGADEGDDCEVAILGNGVAAQFDGKNAHLNESFIGEIEQLSKYVTTHLDQYSPAAKDQRRIMREWNRVDEKIAEYKTRREQDGVG